MNKFDEDLESIKEFYQQSTLTNVHIGKTQYERDILFLLDKIETLDIENKLLKSDIKEMYAQLLNEEQKND